MDESKQVRCTNNRVDEVEHGGSKVGCRCSVSSEGGWCVGNALAEVLAGQVKGAARAVTASGVDVDSKVGWQM